MTLRQYNVNSAYFKKANQAFSSCQTAEAIPTYLEGAAQLDALYPQFEGNLERTRRAYRRQREGLAPRLAVCGWSLSHNPAGRVPPPSVRIDVASLVTLS